MIYIYITGKVRMVCSVSIARAMSALHNATEQSSLLVDIAQFDVSKVDTAHPAMAMSTTIITLRTLLGSTWAMSTMLCGPSCAK